MLVHDADIWTLGYHRVIRVIIQFWNDCQTLFLFLCVCVMFFQNCFTLLHNSFLFHSIFTHRFFFTILKSYTSVTKIIELFSNIVNSFLTWKPIKLVYWIIENTRFVSFDIKFTRQNFENACWCREACQVIHHVFLKPSLVNFISKDTNLVFYLPVYHCFTFQTGDYEVIFMLIQCH